jgi:hypothetical protein
MNFRKLLIYCGSSIALFFLGIAINIACGPEADPYDYYVSFFHNNLAEQDDYAQFSFTGLAFLYNEDEPESEAKINSAEWASYLGGQVKAADVDKAMYGLDGHQDTLLQLGYLAGKSDLPIQLKNNTFLVALRRKQHQEALEYYRFAKRAEPYATVTDAWDPEPRDTATLAKMGEEAAMKARSVGDEFLKLRYYYQAQRLSRYAGDKASAAEVYNRYIRDNKQQSHVKGWAQALQAGIEPDSVRSAYLFSLVFNNYKERRIQAYRNFRYTHAKTDDVLKLARNDRERATIYAMEGLGDPSLNLSYVKKIYEWDPESPVLGVMLTREVNKLEEVFLDPKITKQLPPVKSPVFSYQYYDEGTVGDSLRNVATRHIQEVKVFCDLLFKAHKHPDYAMGKLASAYLCWMTDATEAGFKELSALDHLTLRSKLYDQKQIVNLLLSAQRLGKMSEINEQALLPSLRWLDEKVAAEAISKTDAKSNSWSAYGTHRFATSARNFYQTILAPAYYKQGMISKAAAAVAKGEAPGAGQSYPDQVTRDFWQNNLEPASVQKLITWKNNPPESAYLKLLTKNLRLHSKEDLYELLGTTYLRKHRYKQAIAAFKQVNKSRLDSWASSALWESKRGSNPFISRLADYPRVWITPKLRAYNKLEFAAAMYALQLRMKAAPGDAGNYFKFATALYNTGIHGNSWYYISYGRAAEDAGRGRMYYYDDDYVNSTNAETYFLRARALSKDLEFKAKCTFMAAKCAQKQIPWPGTAYVNYGNDQYDQALQQYGKELRENKYFPDLKGNYSRTRFFKQAVNACSYLRDFLDNGK